MKRKGVQIVAVMLICSLSLPSWVRPAPIPPPVPTPGPALAVAVAIVQIAAAVKGFFDSQDEKRTQQEILQKLGEIQEKLNEIDNKLDVILQRFAELEFHIDHQFELQRTVDVITAIRQIDQHYATWISKGYKPGRNAAVPDPGPILQELRRTATALRETPSYANFATVGLAMVYERLLLVRVFHVKLSDADMQRGFAQYAAFFQNAASANSGSRAVTVGYRWSVADTDWTAFQDAFNRRPNPLICDTGAKICCEEPSNWWYVAKLYYSYSGDLTNGFTKVGDKSDLLTGPGGTAKMLCYNSDHPAFPRRSGCPQNVATLPVVGCDLDQQHAVAGVKKQAADDLNAALDALKQFNEEAEEWAGILPKDRKFPDPRPKNKLDLQLMERLIKDTSLQDTTVIE